MAAISNTRASQNGAGMTDHNPVTQTQIQFSADAPHASKSTSDSVRSSASLPRRSTGLEGISARKHGISPILQRRSLRAATSRTIRAASTYNLRKGWQPGAEPGLDVSKDYGGRSTGEDDRRGGAPSAPNVLPKMDMHEECEITVVDYSQDDMVMRRLTNESLCTWIESEETRSERGEFGKDEVTGKLRTREEWVKCRWINVNGLSWDVIRALGKWKKLHRLAIEDLVNTRNRTKADWYDDHTYLVLTLQKLVHLHPDSEGESDGEGSTDAIMRKGKGGMKTRMSKMKEMLGMGYRDDVSTEDGELHDPSYKYVMAHTEGSPDRSVQRLRTLQRYHDGVNHERATFMEAHSALTAKNLAVCAEQVSIFLTADGTVISFFQSSGEDLEYPLLTRLATPDTILRRTCDASMLLQSLLDAIVDLAIPVTSAYQDVIGDLELDILTDPDIKHTTGLYIVSSEISKMRSFIAPVASLVNALRDHKSNDLPTATTTTVHPSLPTGKDASSVRITPIAYTYLGDVEDHIILILSSLDQMSTSSSHLIDLIFNTISAFQNESMKQLTVVTIFFLPLTFITGYFGMNLTDFPSLATISENLFWAIAVPTVAVVMVWLMRDKLSRWGKGRLQRRGISSRRKKRLIEERKAR